MPPAAGSPAAPAPPVPDALAALVAAVDRLVEQQQQAAAGPNPLAAIPGLVEQLRQFQLAFPETVTEAMNRAARLLADAAAPPPPLDRAAAVQAVAADPANRKQGYTPDLLAKFPDDVLRQLAAAVTGGSPAAPGPPGLSPVAGGPTPVDVVRWSAGPFPRGGGGGPRPAAGGPAADFVGPPLPPPTAAEGPDPRHAKLEAGRGPLDAGVFAAFADGVKDALGELNRAADLGPVAGLKAEAGQGPLDFSSLDGLREKAAALAAEANKTTPPLEKVGKAVEIGGQMAGLAAAGFSQAAQAARTVAGLVTAPFDLLRQGIGLLQSAVAGFVAKANPGQLFRLTLAVDTLLATVGRALAPAVERFIAILGQLAAVVNALSPDSQTLIAGLAAAGVGMGLAAGVLAAVATAFGVAAGVAASAAAAVTALSVAINSATFGLPALAGAITGALAGAATLAGTAAATAGGALGGLALVMTDLRRLGELLDPIMRQLVRAFDAVSAAVLPLVGVVAGAFADLARLAADQVNRAAPVLARLAEAVGGAVAALAPLAGPAVKVLGGLAAALAEWVAAAARVLAGVASLATPFVRVGAAVASVLARVGEAGGRLAGVLGGVFAKVLEFAGGLLEKAATLIERMADALIYLIDEVERFFGLRPQDRPDDGRPLGKAPPPAGRANIGGIDAFAKGIQERAFTASFGPKEKKEDPALKTAENTTAMKTAIDELPNKIGAMIKEAAAQLGRDIVAGVQAAADPRAAAEGLLKRMFGVTG